MKYREKNAVITTVSQIYFTIIASFMPFAIRTLLIKYIGIEYLGIKGLFESIFQIISIVNLGADTSFFSYFLFKPCDEKDYSTVNAFANLIKKFYMIISIIVIFAGLLIMPFLSFFVDNKVYPEDININLIFLIFIIHSVMEYFINYLIIVYAPLLLNYVVSFIYGTSFLLMYTIQILTILFFKNYTLFMLESLISTTFMIIAFYIYNRKHIPWLTYKGKLSTVNRNDIKKRLLPMIFSKIRNVSRNSIDCIVISHFLGLTILAKYQNYYHIIKIPLMIVGILNYSIQAVLGNGISAETPDSNYGILFQFTFLQNYIVTVCTTCLIVSIQPFIKLWVGMENLLGFDIVICVVIYFYVLSIATIGVLLRNTTGTWEKGMWVSVVETVLNLLFNIIFIRYFGLWGVIFSSIITVGLINIPFEFRYVFKNYFLKNYREYIYIILKNTLITSIIIFISYFICIQVEVTNFFGLFLRLVLAILISTTAFFLMHHNDREYKETKHFIFITIKEVINNFKKIKYDN